MLTGRLLQHSARVTLFTRPNCDLCDVAKAIIRSTSHTRDFQYSEVDIMSAGQNSWRLAYEFDTPVVRQTVRNPFS